MIIVCVMTSVFLVGSLELSFVWGFCLPRGLSRVCFPFGWVCAFFVWLALGPVLGLDCL